MRLLGIESAPARMRKPTTVVINRDIAHAIVCVKPDDDIACAAVFADVDQRFLHDPRELAATTRRQVDHVLLRDEPSGDAGVELEALDDPADRLDELIWRKLAS